ncbi:uncharacterized protein [Rutidosis leptorrhynchoides]|uniref:uncharacterized protein n=1 Tax=Rutidosis leptorrhynchoides TaxID=125765 RepID=UPI003A99BA33
MASTVEEISEKKSKPFIGKYPVRLGTIFFIEDRRFQVKKVRQGLRHKKNQVVHELKFDYSNLGVHFLGTYNSNDGNTWILDHKAHIVKLEEFFWIKNVEMLV